MNIPNNVAIYSQHNNQTGEFYHDIAVVFGNRFAGQSFIETGKVDTSSSKFDWYDLESNREYTGNVSGLNSLRRITTDEWNDLTTEQREKLCSFS